MSYKNIHLIYKKELLGAIRDRRTLISMIIIPLVFYPLLFLGIGYFTLVGQEKTQIHPSQVAIKGEENAPLLKELLSDDDRIKLVFYQEGEIVENKINEKELNLLLEISEDIQIEGEQATTQEIIIKYDSTIQRSQVAVKRVADLVEKYRQRIIEDRLGQFGIDINYIEPLEEQLIDVSSEERKIGSMLGMLLPYIIVILIFMGAMHSAVDITAGEKERGTLATLLVSQVSRLEIVIGKYLTVMTVSATSMLLGLIGLGIALLAPAYSMGEFSFVEVSFSPSMFFLFFLVLAPLVSLASAVLLLIGIFARNNKEASTYVTPIYMMSIFLGMISLTQGMELAGPMFYIPILNNSVTFKELLMGNINWAHIINTMVSNVVIALLALFLSARLFTKESVLFRS